MAGFKTNYVKRLVVRYIWDRKLRPGAKLPTQTEMRGIFKCSSETLTSVVNILAREGMVTVRDKVGVFVADPSASPEKGRRVAVVTTQMAGLPSSAFQLIYAVQALNREDCMTMNFLRPTPSEMTVYNSLESLPELKRAIENKEVDAILSFILFDAGSEEYFRRSGIPFSYIGNLEERNSCIHMDLSYIIGESVRRLAETGIRRIEFLLLSNLGEWEIPFLNAMKKYVPGGARPDSVHLLRCESENYNAVLESQVRRWLELPPEERPEGLVVPDDMLSWQICYQLLPFSWRPKIISMRNTDIDLPISDNVIGWWENDLSIYAALGVENFMTMLRDDEHTQGSFTYVPHYVSRESALSR